MAVKMEAHETVGSAPATPGLEQCLELLRGPQDEKRCVIRYRVFLQQLLNTSTTKAICWDVIMPESTTVLYRFVGLLLATKLLPAGNKEVLTAVSSAVGFRFLTRLLLPLRSHQVCHAHAMFAMQTHPAIAH